MYHNHTFDVFIINLLLFMFFAANRTDVECEKNFYGVPDTRGFCSLLDDCYFTRSSKHISE